MAPSDVCLPKMFFSSQKSIVAITSLDGTEGAAVGTAKMKLSSVFRSFVKKIEGRFINDVTKVGGGDYVLF